MSMVEAHARGEHQFAAMPGCPTCSNAELQRVRREKDDLDALREAQEGHVKMTVYANQLEHQAREQAKEIERLKKERDGAVKQALEQHRIVQDQGWELRAANGRTERLEEAARPVLSWASQCPPNGEVVQHQWKAALTALREALRPAAPECHCTGDGHKADCALWVSLAAPQETRERQIARCRTTPGKCFCGVHISDVMAAAPQAPAPTPSEEKFAGLPYSAQFSTGSEQPDLPLGHPFKPDPDDPFCARMDCGQPESAHRRK